MKDAEILYVIKVIEPDKEYIKYFKARDLQRAKQQAQEHLWSCPDNTEYIYVATRIVNDRKFKSMG